MQATNRHGSFKFTVVVVVGKPAGYRSTSETRTEVQTIEKESISYQVHDIIASEFVPEVRVEMSPEVSSLEEVLVKVKKVREEESGKEEKDKIEEVKSPKKTKKPWEETSSSSESDFSSSESSSEDNGSSSTEGQPPKFIIPPEPKFVDEGETLVLSCKISGYTARVWLAT